MIYNSFLYIILFPILFLLLYSMKNKVIKKYFLLITSYTLFYYYNKALVIVLLTVTLVSYFFAWGMERVKNNDNQRSYQRCKKILASIGITTTLLPLLFYKYTDFILSEIFHVGSLSAQLTLVAPLGISFFTFQAISYLCDVYQGKYQAEHHLPTYMLYVSFFPSVMAGPINRFDILKPQLESIERPDYKQMTNGIKMMAWGMFLKTVIADRLLLYVNPVLDEYINHCGSELLMGSLLYSIQLYTDFAGYSLLAIGSALMLGIRLQQNFHNPYFAHSITDFWHRWHISLSTWLRDYIYIPLGGSRCRKGRTYFNILVTFLVSGIWHGANWTFILWGSLHGVFQVLEKRLGIAKEKNKMPKWMLIARILITFLLINFLWIFFRMPTVSDAMEVIYKIFTEQDMNFWVFEKFIFVFILMAFLKDLIDEVTPAHNPFHHHKAWVRWITYIVVTTSICLFGVFDSGQFIYAGF